MKKINKRKIEKIAKEHKLSFVLLFGSQASGKTHFASDFDFAFLSKSPISLKEELNIRYELVKILKTEYVDTVDMKRAGPLLLRQIFDSHKILYCKNMDEYYRYKIYADKRYIEAMPIFKIRERSIDSFIKKYA